MIVQTSPSPIVSYPGKRSALETARQRSPTEGRWTVIEQLGKGWFTAIDSALLADPHVTAGVPYRTIAVYENGFRVTDPEAEIA